MSSAAPLQPLSVCGPPADLPVSLETADQGDGACAEVDSDTEAVAGRGFKLGCISCKRRSEVEGFATVEWYFRPTGESDFSPVNADYYYGISQIELLTCFLYEAADISDIFGLFCCRRSTKSQNYNRAGVPKLPLDLLNKLDILPVL